jgi:hypothetical protein
MWSESRIGVVIAFVAMAAGIAACGPPSQTDPPDEERQELDHQTVVDYLDANTRSMTRLASDSVRFMEESELALHFADFTYGDPCPPDGGECTDTTPTIDTSLTEPTDSTLDQLLSKLITRDTIVDQSPTQITYTMDAEALCENVSCATLDSGESVCTYDDGAPGQATLEQACSSNIEEMNYRVEVWSPSAGNLNFSIEVGPGYNPFDGELHTDHVSVTGRLGAFRKSVKHGDEVYGTTVADEFPQTFAGTVYALIEEEDSRKIHFEARVQSDINIGGGDVQFQLASPGQPIVGATAEGAGELVSTTFNLDTLEASFPASYYDYESEESVSVSHTAHLAGLTGRILFDGTSEQLEIKDLSFGDSTSWLDMEGERVLSFDLNPQSGRSFDLTAGADSVEDVFTASVSPGITGSIDLNFGRVQTQIDWMSEWIKDDTFDLSLTGSNPSVRWGLSADDYRFIEVQSGTMELASESPEYTRTVSSGSCLVDQETSNPKVSWYHPLEGIGSGSCP